MNYIGLAKLAFNRKAPEALELLWLRRTGINPVAIANRMRWHRTLKFVLCWCLIPPLVLILSFGIVAFCSGVLNKQLVMLGTIVAILDPAFLTVLLGLVYSEASSREERESVVLYCDDLSSLSMWSNQSYSALRLRERALREVATKILIGQAAKVVTFQRAARFATGPMEEMDQNLLGGKELATLKVMFTVLNRLGIADLDDKPIFDQANKLVDQQEEAEQEAARKAQLVSEALAAEREPVVACPE